MKGVLNNAANIIAQTVTTDAGCWEWQGWRTKGGYGVATCRRKKVLVHRFVFEELVGPIPDGLQIDHLCRNRACCNPEHLEPVTPAENTRRGANVTKTECKYGHAYAGENVRRGANGRRYCVLCSRAKVRRYRERQMALVAA